MLQGLKVSPAAPRPVAALLLAFMLLLAAVLPAAANDRPVLVFDMKTGEVLLERGAGRPWYPASLTKLMTAYLVFEAVTAGRLRLDQKVTISRNAANGGGRGAARYGARPGERLSVHTMLSFLLVRSDADMAVALAEAVAGSESAFVERMNATARRLGMSGTRFANAHGMHDPRQVTTARDMGLLAMAIYHRFLRRNPAWWRYFSAPYVMKGKVRKKNRNKLLEMMPEANGMKTGFICASGFNLLATASRGGRLLGAVVLGRRTGHTRALYARIMLEEGFRRIIQPARRKGPFIASLRNTGGEPKNLRAAICRRQRIRMAAPENVSPAGWAVAFGRYRRAVDAEEVLAAELTAAGLPESPPASGVARLPEDKAWAGLAWNLDDRTALTLCALARVHKTPCNVYGPQAFAALVPDLLAQREKYLAREAARERARQQRKARGNWKKRRHKAASRKTKKRKVRPAGGG
jgi:D-alanyl-D-alanine carboxypeptidase